MYVFFFYCLLQKAISLEPPLLTNKNTTRQIIEDQKED